MSKLLVLLGTISLLTPFTLDIYLPALPAIAADLRASAGAVQLTLPVFFVCLAVSQLLFGSLADHIGRRPPLLWGLALLVAGSVGCALSHGLALALTPHGASAGTASALFGTLQFLLAGLAGAAVSALYDGTPLAMTEVICAVAGGAVVLYRWLK